MTEAIHGTWNLEGSNPLLVAAAQIAEQIEELRRKTRELYFAVVLFRRPCPHCGSTALRMLRDSWCTCKSCGNELDPTLAFGTCGDCGGALIRKRCHYWCESCRHPVRSRFCFDGRVFDAAYFREMMRQSRERKREKRQLLREQVAEARSSPYAITEEPSLADAPGLLDDLDQAVGLEIPKGLLDVAKRARFDMHAYQKHIRELVAGCIVHFEGIAQLVDDRRLDRIFRFITIIFMAHRGELEITQTDDGTILITGN